MKEALIVLRRNWNWIWWMRSKRFAWMGWLAETPPFCWMMNYADWRWAQMPALHSTWKLVATWWTDESWCPACGPIRLVAAYYKWAARNKGSPQCKRVQRLLASRFTLQFQFQMQAWRIDGVMSWIKNWASGSLFDWPTHEISCKHGLQVTNKPN